MLAGRHDDEGVDMSLNKSTKPNQKFLLFSDSSPKFIFNKKTFLRWNTYVFDFIFFGANVTCVKRGGTRWSMIIFDRLINKRMTRSSRRKQSAGRQRKRYMVLVSLPTKTKCGTRYFLKLEVETQMCGETKIPGPRQNWRPRYQVINVTLRKQ